MLAILLLIAPLAMDPGAEACLQEIHQIDSQIDKLQKAWNMHAQKASEYQQKGDSWKYETYDIQTAYDNWAKADAEREQMMQIQEKIDALNRRKNWILNFYPQLGR